MLVTEDLFVLNTDFLYLLKINFINLKQEFFFKKDKFIQISKKKP